MSDFIKEALAQMAAAGLLVENPIMDGALQRCPVAGKPKGRAGAYIIHMDKPQAAWFRNWQTGFEDTFCAKAQDAMTAKERRAYQAFIKQARARAAQEREKRLASGKKAMLALWSNARPAQASHAYLQAKDVPIIGDLRLDWRGNLLIPVYDAENNIQSVQRIPPAKIDGKWSKFFVADCQTGGGFYPMPAKDGARDGPLLICEGYATAASCHLATGHACLVAFNAGNLEKVASLARQLYPARKICLCADYDEPNEQCSEPGGVGVAYAKDAAIKTGCWLAVCPAIEGGKADFNDIALHDSLARVESVINKALAGEPANACAMPEGYRLIKTGARAGLYFNREGKDGNLESVRLGPPLEVLADTRDANGNDWGLYLRWLDNDGKEHTWAMPKTLLYMLNGDWFARLAFGGWHGNPNCRKLIANFLADVRPARRIRCIDQTGWQSDCYVLPDAVYGQSGNEELVLQSMQHNELYQTRGEFEQWREIARLCVGNSRLGFALACAFAGPLLKLCGLEGGCFAFEGESSSGKTTALKVAASVWGGENHVRGWRTTDNGLENLAALHNDNILILDELSQVGAGVLDEAIYMLANGAGKTRAARNGSLRKSHRWLALVLSSGELGLADKLAEDGRKARAGQEVRFCGVPVEKANIQNLHGHKDAGALAQQLGQLCAGNYGHAGRRFLQKLVEPEVLANCRQKLRAGIEKEARAVCPENSDSQVLRVAMRFMLAGYAGQLAVQTGILPKEFEAAQYARECFGAWLEKRGSAGACEDAAILAQVKLFIEQHGQSRFQDYENANQNCINRAGFRKEDLFYCLPETFKKEIARGYSLKKTIAVLVNAGWLQRQNGRNQEVVHLPGFGKKRVYSIRLPQEA